MDDALTDILFCALYVLVPLTVLALLPSVGISLRRFSIPSFFIIVYLVTIQIGILPFYLKWDRYSVSLGIVDKMIILKMFVYSSASLFTIIGGFSYARHVLGFDANATSHRVLLTANTRQRMFMFCLFLLCGLVLLDYIRQVSDIALFKALRGDVLGAAVARSNMGNAFPGKYWRYELFFRELLDYSVIFSLADFLMRRRRISLLLFGGIFVVAVFSATMAIEKGAFLRLLVMLYLAYVICKGGNYWQPALKYVAIVMIGSLLLFYKYFMGAPNVQSALQSIIGRIFFGQISPAYFYVYLFPRHIDYLWGASFPNPAHLLPFENFPLTVEVSKFIFPQSFAMGIVGSAPTVFWAETYANFGPIGVVFSSFLVGIGLHAISHILSSLPLSPPVIAATAFLAMHYRTLTGSSLSSYFVDTTLFAIAFVTFTALSLTRKVSSVQGRTPAAKVGEALVHAE